MDMLEPGTKGDITAIKEKVFGPQLFWVTEAKPEIGKLPGAYLVSPSEPLTPLGTNVDLSTLMPLDSST